MCYALTSLKKHNNAAMGVNKFIYSHSTVLVVAVAVVVVIAVFLLLSLMNRRKEDEEGEEDRENKQTIYDDAVST